MVGEVPGVLRGEGAVRWRRCERIESGVLLDSA